MFDKDINYKDLLETTCSSFLDEAMELNDLPGIAAGVSIGAEPVEFTGARGFKNYITSEPLLADDIFHCASVSKLFTSLAIMKLIEAGALNLYDRITRLLPNLNWDLDDELKSEVRLWNLLTHTSGFDDCRDYLWNLPDFDEDALERYVSQSTDSKLPLLWPPQVSPEFYNPVREEVPGENLFSYSNIAYEILGHIVSRYSDKMPDARGVLSYEDFIMEYLMKPAHMNSSTMLTFSRDGWASETSNIGASNMAYPHEKAADRSIRLCQYYPYNRAHGPSSTLTSNLADLLKWGRANMKSAKGRDEILLHSDTYDTIWRDYATVPNNGEKMGLGWFMRYQRCSSSSGSKQFRLFGHEGTDDGFRASFWMCPELDMVTVVLSNISNAPVKKLNKKLFSKICEKLDLC